jgi:hypothetical protein
METIQFIATTPETLRDGINKDLKSLLSNFFKERELQDELLTREEAAKFLKVGLSALHEWTKSKKLISYGIGNRVYYKKNELIASLQRLNE